MDVPLPPGARLGAAHSAAAADDALYRRISWRLMPLLFACYVVNYLDRTNIGYAQLQMRDALQLGDAAFATGAAMFFVGYALFEVPSNLWLARVGVRRTLLRIMLLWGLASAATAFVTTPLQFYAARFLVGVFEAGFAPGVLYYLTLWYPPQRRARANALFFMGFAAAPIVSGPLAGVVMTGLAGVGGLGGWQWLFLVEAVPALLLGAAAWRWLDDTPAQAAWLDAGERERAAALLRAAPAPQAASAHWSSGLRAPRAWGLGLLGLLVVLGVYALAFWQPTLLKGLGLSVMEVGMAAVLPAAAGLAASLWWGGRSDRRGERRLHFALPALAGAAGLWWAGQGSSVAATLAALTLAGAGISAAFTVLWACPALVLPRSGLAAGIALISTCSACAGVAAPLLVAALRTADGGFGHSLAALAAALVAAAVLVFVVLPRQAAATAGPGR